MRALASAVALSAALAFLAAGCGGGKSDEEKWASSVCTNVSNWKQQIQKSVSGARSSLESPGAGTLDAIKTDVNQAVDATKQLSSNLKALGRPNNKTSGHMAEDQVDSLATQLENTVNQAKQTISTLPKSATLTQVTSQLASLGPALQSLVTNMKTTLSSIQSSSSDLKKGFEQADSCKQLQRSS